MQWAPTRCSPRNSESAALNAGAGPLATVRIAVPDTVTSTTLSVPDSAATGTAVQLAATVAPAGASGTVQFRDGGANIGAPVPVVDGSASLSYAFGSLGPTASRRCTREGGIASSTSEARTVTVTPPVVATSTTVTVPPTATTDLAVDLVAAVTPSAPAARCSSRTV
ncbi:Ig-like domain repeat protein, partial [Rhodococcus hoagii]|nr:Ig-like domain repeat protein [Prescottella equi]